MRPFHVTLHYFGHYGTSDDPVVVDIISLDRHMEVKKGIRMTMWKGLYSAMPSDEKHCLKHTDILKPLWANFQHPTRTSRMGNSIYEGNQGSCGGILLNL